MEGALSSIMLMLLGALLVVALSKKFKLQSEIVVIVTGAVISFVPVMPHIQIDGQLFLFLILPPILFSSARNIGAYKFNSLKRPIISLGVILVFVTGILVGAIAYYVVPFLSIGTALIIGALVGPTDAVSAIAIGKKLKLNDRVLSIMTGESLINDASALTLYSVALALSMETETFISNPIFLFLYQLGLGLFIGVILGMVTHLIRKVLKDASLITVFTAIIPYTAYIAAESLDASGVIAVVAVGFAIERSSFEANYSVRLQERSFWHSIDTLFETMVFGYLGLQTCFAFTELTENGISAWQAIMWALPILAATVLIRPLWIFATSWVGQIQDKFSQERLRRASKNLYSRFTNEAVRKRMRLKIIQKHNELKNYKISAATFRDNIILSWCGMRGVVSLAIAASVPLAINNGEGTLISSFILVVGLVVAASTLIVQASTLPILIRKISVEDPEHTQWVESQNQKARELLDASAFRYIEELDDEDFDFPIERITQIWDSFRHPIEDVANPNYESIVGLLKDIIERQRDDIVEATNSGMIDPDIAKEILRKLDHREAIFGA